jgi:hypothetical protein
VNLSEWTGFLSYISIQNPQTTTFCGMRRKNILTGYVCYDNIQNIAENNVFGFAGWSI